MPLETVRAVARLARSAGARVILDPAPAPAPANPLPDDLLADVDYLTPNETELAAVRHSVGSVIVTMGEAGATLIERDRDGDGGKHEHHWRAPATHVVDTTAAGDTFNAALAVALADGASIEDAGTFACAAASISVSRAGAQASMPTLDEVHAILRR